MTDIVPVQRTSHGLVDALFNVIDRLNAKEIDAEHARAISHTAKTIVSVAALELECRKFASEGGGAKLISLAIEEKK
jgi:hypothetical protein